MVKSVRFLFPSPNLVGHPMPPRWTPDGIPPNGSVVLFPMPMTGFITFPSVGFTLRKFPAGTWLWSEAHGWIWTSSEAFPHFYRNTNSNWIYLIPTGYGKSYYDYSSESFE